MTARNLALVWAPNFVSDSELNLDTQMKTSAEAVKYTTFIIENFLEIFPVCD